VSVFLEWLLTVYTDSGVSSFLTHLEQSSLFQVVSLTWICNERNASLHIIISSVPHVLYQGKSVV